MEYSLNLTQLNEACVSYKSWHKINQRIVRSIYDEMTYENFYGYLMFFDCILSHRWDVYVEMN